jgi:lauroyl/myristoyl acyltransferase
MTMSRKGRACEPATSFESNVRPFVGKGFGDARKEPWYHHRFNHPAALKTVFSIIPKVPKVFHPPIAAVTALLFFLALGKERKAIYKNLKYIHPSGVLCRQWKTYKTFYSFCDFIVSYCYVPNADHTQLKSMLADPDYSGEKIERCLRMQNGLIVWTAHLGNWEFASRLLELHDVPVNVARVVERGKPAEIMLRDMMQSNRLRIVELNEDIFASVRLIHALRENQIVAMQGDRAFSDYCGNAVFFGRKTKFPLGPFLLSYVSGAPILPGFVIREGWLQYRVITGNPIEIVHTNDREKDLQNALEQAVGFLEQTVGSYSDQWVNFFDFWTMQSAR